MKARNKKIIIAVICAGVAALAGTGIWYGVKKMDQTKVDVYPVADLKQQIWGMSTSIDGTISSSVTQEVHLMDKQIVDQVYVQEGQEVVEGTPLLSYDMTLVNIDLEMEKINKEQLLVKKKGLEKELEKLKNANIIPDSQKSEAGGEGSGGNIVGAGSKAGILPLGLKETNTGTGGRWEASFSKMAASQNAGRTADSGEQGNPGKSDDTENSGNTGDSGNPGDSDDSGNPDDSNKPGGSENPDDSDKPGGSENPDDSDKPGGSENPDDSDKPGGSENPDDTDNPGDSDDPEKPNKPVPSMVYDKLYGDITLETIPGQKIENAIPYKGTGTKEDPYYYLCKKDVKIQGAFLNQIAGYGTSDTKEKEPVYCILEVRDKDDKDGFLIAALCLDGSKITQLAAPEKWYLTHLGTYTEEEPQIPDEENPDGDDGEEFPDDWDFMEEIPQDDIIEGYTQDELNKAITEKKKEIKTAELDIRGSSLKIQNVEKKLENQTVESILNGVVKKVGDPGKGEVDGEAFLVVESSEGSYVKGLADEYQLQQLQPGSVLTGFSYESGLPIEAEVKEISNFPSSNNMYGYGREVSYYPFTAYIKNSDGLKNMEGVSLDLPSETENPAGLYISKEYVRNKDGKDFVYVEGKDHRLERRNVQVGKNFYGSMLEIKNGLTEEDHIAFPYGKKVKEGVKVRRAAIEDLYSMY
ncbi:hypothetical protein PMF13cell1_03381 [Blautia producta]|uniref:HlyD family secretion protein n=1 Tax=Blautia producta TaxID=33035 RepID=A0A4V0Z7S5_9FIRM|nr:hypothetical protein [Blautia producta]QBE97818.1 hypothetical protein PMF13cell1_03381 [Blautia producta]